MDIPLSEAKALLTDLVRRAEGGEDIVLTRHGRQVARITPVERAMVEDRRAFLYALSARAAEKALPGASAARSQDYLYGEDGLPE